jgi:hypothetical protein
MKGFLKNVIGTIRAKSSTVVTGMIFLGLLYIIYSQILSPIRINRLRAEVPRAEVSLADNNISTDDLIDARVPIQEAFGTYDTCVDKGYDAQFCLRSAHSYKRPEHIPL